MNTPPLQWSADDRFGRALRPWSCPTRRMPRNSAPSSAIAGIEDVTDFTAQVRISPLSGGRFRASGTLKASVVQASVVNLEPVPSSIQESFSVEYWPPEAIVEAGEDIPFDAEAARASRWRAHTCRSSAVRDFRACARPISPQSGRHSSTGLRLKPGRSRVPSQSSARLKPDAPPDGEVGIAVQSLAAPQYFDCQPKLIQYVLPLGSWLSPYVAARGWIFRRWGRQLQLRLTRWGEILARPS